jgi:D-glycero-D-manno-heptose 1,7-bisphosphate phosphatase
VRRTAVFLDRDGVINRAIIRDGRPFAPKDLNELEILPQVPEAIGTLKSEGFDIIVVTNQPDVSRGTATREAVDAINSHLRAELRLDEVITCYHQDADNCECRKPKPGMLRMAEKTRDIELTRSFLVGDRWRDIEAGVAAGCRTIFLDYGYAERRPTQADHVCKTLYEAANWIKANRVR